MCDTECLSYLEDTQSLTICKSPLEDDDFLFRIVAPQSITYCVTLADTNHLMVVDNCSDKYGRFCIANLDYRCQIYISLDRNVGYMNRQTVSVFGEENEHINLKEELGTRGSLFDYRYVNRKFEIVFMWGCATIRFTDECLSKEYKAVVIGFVIGMATMEHHNYMMDYIPFENSYHIYGEAYQSYLDSCRSSKAESTPNLYSNLKKLSLVPIGENWVEKATYSALVDVSESDLYSKPTKFYVKYCARQNKFELISAVGRSQMLEATVQAKKCCINDARRQIGILDRAGKYNIWSVVACYGEMKEVFKSLREPEQSKNFLCLNVNENVIGSYQHNDSSFTLKLTDVSSSLKRLIIVDFVLASLPRLATKMPMMQEIDSYFLVATKRHNDPLKTLQMLQAAHELALWYVGYDSTKCLSYSLILDKKTGHNYFYIESELHEENDSLQSDVVKNFRGREIVKFIPNGDITKVDIFSGENNTPVGSRIKNGCHVTTDDVLFITENMLVKPRCLPSVELVDNQQTNCPKLGVIEHKDNVTTYNMCTSVDEKKSRTYYAFILSAMLNAHHNIFHSNRKQVIREVTVQYQ